MALPPLPEQMKGKANEVGKTGLRIQEADGSGGLEQVLVYIF